MTSGKYIRTMNHRNIISLAMQGKKRKPFSEEWKKKLSYSHKGRKHTKEQKQKIGIALTGHHHNEETKRKIGLANSIALKGKKLTPEHIKNALKRKPISSLEQKFLFIIKKNNLPYEFVGNGKFFIENKCPDFINCNGQKIAVEVFYRKHKEVFRDGLENWKMERQKIFSKYGWKIIFFDETFKEEDVLRCLISQN